MNQKLLITAALITFLGVLMPDITHETTEQGSVQSFVVVVTNGKIVNVEQSLQLPGYPQPLPVAMKFIQLRSQYCLN